MLVRFVKWICDIMITTPIEIDKYRNLRYDWKTMMDVERAMGAPFGKIPVLLNVSSIETIVTLLWAGLKWEDESMQDKSAGIDIAADLATQWCEMSGGRFGDLQDVLVKALIDSGWLNPPSSDQVQKASDQGEVSQASGK